MSKKFDVTALVAKAAVAFHEKWRSDWQNRSGNTATSPRWKETTDTAWLKANAGKPYCQDGQVNLNTEFGNLPVDWKRDNVEAAEIAIPIAIAAYEGGRLDDPNYEQVAGAAIHTAWLDRRRGTEGGTDEFKKLDIPFADLEAWRQEQDMLQARISRTLVQEAAA